MADGLSGLEKLVGLVLTVVTGLTAFSTSRVDNQLKEQGQHLEALKTQISLSAEAREDRKLNQDITKAIFDEYSKCFSEAEQTPEARISRLNGVAALTEALPDPTVKIKLLAAIDAAQKRIADAPGAPPAAKVQAAEAQKANELAVFAANDQETQLAAEAKAPEQVMQSVEHPRAGQPRWGNYDFDIFWCEGASDPVAAAALAERLKTRVQALDPKASGRWRVRKLLKSVNSRAGYRVSGYQINASAADEKPLAEAFRAAVLADQSLGGAATDFQIRSISYPTPWYLSVFVCPGATP